MARSPRSRSGRRDPIDRTAEKVDRKVSAAEAKVQAKLDTADAKARAELAASDSRTNAKLSAADRKLAAAQAKIDAKTAQASAELRAADAKVQATGATAAAALGRVAAHLDALDLWTRSEPGPRKPRLGRAELASASIRVADAEGIDAVSMRRLAAELDVGTMTLYHYVRTKDELLALMVDELLEELIVPEGELPDDWRAAMTAIARRSRDSLRRHPWVFDIANDPTIGPNAMRHVDQSWEAVSRLEADFQTKLDVITAVDDYVFGFCIGERRSMADRQHEDDDGMLTYLAELMADGDYPTLQALTDDIGLPELWARMERYHADEERFERNLARLLAAFADGSPAGDRG